MVSWECPTNPREASGLDPEAVHQRDVRGVLPVENEATIRETDEGWTVEASARGVPLSSITAREVKAVTYSEMQLEPVADGWRAYVVFDV